MHSLTLLLFIFIALNGKQLRNDSLYRANVFAIVGICYFFFVQYIAYWNRVFPVEGWGKYLLEMLVALGAVGLSLSSWNKKSHPIKTLCLCSIFFIALLVTYVFDIKVKEWLAEKGGFFNGEPPLVLKQEAGTLDKSIKFSEVGIEFRAFEGWRKGELPSGHEYLTYGNSDAGVVEVRPNCLDGMNIDTPTYVSNMLELLEVNKPTSRYDYQCSKSAQVKECFIRVEYLSADGVSKRWHWLRSQRGERSIAVDFIIPNDSKVVEEKVLELIMSTKISKKHQTVICTTPAAWL
ncbi:hypothetical protein OQJ46_11825 [Microbulbifer thermotolerans]|uniref:hypothetical protein n=1 Tax=Microbulbifer thermotolerans TaxID=252514 RepID=UPI00224ADEEE|nr:hypothetical protein [Microbulbifer thermotolerans]MCX2783674.1 hypothetical protein [Microbulbifer thermotolerans]